MRLSRVRTASQRDATRTLTSTMQISDLLPLAPWGQARTDPDGRGFEDHEQVLRSARLMRQSRLVQRGMLMPGVASGATRC